MNRKLEGEWRSLVTGGSRGIGPVAVPAVSDLRRPAVELELGKIDEIRH
jgi:hypothetical protein